MRLWYDTDNGDTRYESDSGSGPPVVETRRGDTARYAQGEQGLEVMQAVTETSRMLRVADGVLWPRRENETGNLPVFDTGFVNGRPALLVYDGAFGEPGGAHYVVWVDEDSLLPLLEITTGTVPADLNDPPHTEVITATWVYSVTEFVDRSELPSDFFEFEPESPDTAETQTYMTVDEASEFTDFAVYYLGEEFDGLPIFALGTTVLSGTVFEEEFGLPSFETFSATYAESYENPDRRGDQIGVEQQSASAGYNPLSGLEGGTPVNIGGTPAMLYNQGGTCLLVMEKEGTSIEIYAKNALLAVQAAESLQRLN